MSTAARVRQTTPGRIAPQQQPRGMSTPTRRPCRTYTHTHTVSISTCYPYSPYTLTPQGSSPDPPGDTPPTHPPLPFYSGVNFYKTKRTCTSSAVSPLQANDKFPFYNTCAAAARNYFFFRLRVFSGALRLGKRKWGR